MFKTLIIAVKYREYNSYYQNEEIKNTLHLNTDLIEESMEI